jgi:glycerol-3-phosphate dehydrogenase
MPLVTAQDLASISREQTCSALAGASFDLVVVGGGIHGACVAKLAAKIGLRTALLEQFDYASGTSSRSSKMAHGGLRYLEMFDFQQVFEGIKAREELFEKCPHLVTPERFLIPVPRGSHLFKYKLGIGLFLYDLMVQNRERKHRWIPRRELSFTSFHNQREDLEGCFLYTDGLMNDTRLVIDMVVSGREYGLCALNYAQVVALTRREDGDTDVAWRDGVQGTEHTLRGRVVVNCAGPWAPMLTPKGRGEGVGIVRYSRGTHLVFSTPWRDPSLFLPLSEAGRYYFVWPHPAGTLVGTTEREVHELEDDPQPTDDEVEEILARLERDLPGSGLTRATLHYAFAGIRTLPLRSGRKGVSRLSRKHIWQQDRGVLTLLGGKYTTFAWTAGEGLKLALGLLGQRNVDCPDALDDLPTAATVDERLRIEREVLQRYPEVSREGLARALRRLGHGCALYLDRPSAWGCISPGVLRLEVYRSIEIEQAISVEDCTRRRIDLESTVSHGLDAADGIGQLLIANGIHTPAEVQREIDGIRSRLERGASAPLEKG